jgi:hypothetical protein
MASQMRLNLAKLNTHAPDLYLEIVSTEELKRAVSPRARKIAASIQSFSFDEGAREKALGR